MTSNPYSIDIRLSHWNIVILDDHPCQIGKQQQYQWMLISIWEEQMKSTSLKVSDDAKLSSAWR